MAALELQRLVKTYEGGVRAVRGIDLSVEDGELFVLLGPSGCGKSTLLRLVAGLESPSAGEIWMGDRRIDDVPPQERDVAMVFQSYALYGHMTVRENLEFPLRMRGVDRRARRRKAEEVAELLELGPLLGSRPAALSGGQQQRVAMGRALVRRPRAFLLDEPLSNLDARLRGEVRARIARLQRRLAVTTLYVTHDQGEALALGDRVAVLRDGIVQQVGPGPELYDRPATTFVAQFLGQPGMNLLPGRPVADGEGWRVEIGGRALDLPRHLASGLRRIPGAVDRVVLGVRPESIDLVDGEEPGDLEVEVLAVEDLGRERWVHLGGTVETLDVLAPEPTIGPAGAGGPPLVASVDRTRRAPGPGERVAIRVGPRGLHLFDPRGQAIDGPGPGELT